MKKDHANDSIVLEESALMRRGNQSERTTTRDFLLPLFRQRRLAFLVFAGVLCGALLTALLMPRKYRAEMKIFVNRDRADNVISPALDTAPASVTSVSQEDLNSEVELLTSRDLLDQVVLRCGLEREDNSWWSRIGGRFTGHDSAAVRLAKAEQNLRSALIVEPLQKTTVIRVAYASRNPRKAAEVLRTLATLYQAKHAAVHRLSGSFHFFDQQAAIYRDELSDAETRRITFNLQEGVVEPAVERELALEQLSKFAADQQQDDSEASAAAARVRELLAEAQSAPTRQTTEMRQTDNAQLLAELRNTLLALELKRTDMLIRYAPSYPPVKDVETQIEQTEKAIRTAEQSPVSEVTTDRVPAQDWIATELAKARADRAQYSAQAASLERTVRHYQSEAQRLDQIGQKEADLARSVKAAEDNYLLYLRKREEARISDALDERKIVNVSLAEAPTVPALPSEPLGWVLIGGTFTACISSIGAAYAVDRMDSSFRTPDELNTYLQLKVLAAIPRDATSLIKS